MRQCRILEGCAKDVAAVWLIGVVPGVEPPPFLRLHEGPRPDPALGILRLVLLRLVGLGEAVGDRPALAHHPRIDVGAVGELADREHAPVAVERLLLARDLAPADQVAQLARGAAAARPRLAAGVVAILDALGRVDPLEPDVGARDDHGIAVDHPGFADDGVGGRRVPALVAVEAHRTDHEQNADQPLRLGAAQGAPPGRSACESSHRSGCRLYGHGRESAPVR